MVAGAVVGVAERIAEDGSMRNPEDPDHAGRARLRRERPRRQPGRTEDVPHAPRRGRCARRGRGRPGRGGARRHLRTGRQGARLVRRRRPGPERPHHLRGVGTEEAGGRARPEGPAPRDRRRGGGGLALPGPARREGRHVELRGEERAARGGRPARRLERARRHPDRPRVRRRAEGVRLGGPERGRRPRVRAADHQHTGEAGRARVEERRRLAGRARLGGHRQGHRRGLLRQDEALPRLLTSASWRSRGSRRAWAPWTT